MLTCVKRTWTNNLVICYCIFAVNALRRNRPESISNWDTESEPGFDLNAEDIAKFHIWPKGTIPYYIDDFSFDKVLRNKIRIFLDGVNRLTVLRFLEIHRPPEDDTTRWVLFMNRKGMLDCADLAFQNFTNEGVQRVVLGYHCLNSDENLADIVLSLVGVPPQHNAPNRDKNIAIQENNILRDKLYLFEKLKDDQWLFHNLAYDVESAGHYGPYKYTKNGKVTVQQKSNYKLNPPPKPKEKGFSSNDILKIAMLYNFIVKNRETPVPECGKLFSPGSKLSSIFLKDTFHKVKPRNKPSQYLGIKEQVSDVEDNDENEIDNDKKSYEDKEANDSKLIDSDNMTSYEHEEDIQQDEEYFNETEVNSKIQDETNERNEFIDDINNDNNNTETNENNADGNKNEENSNDKRYEIKEDNDGNDNYDENYFHSIVVVNNEEDERSNNSENTKQQNITSEPSDNNDDENHFINNENTINDEKYNEEINENENNSIDISEGNQYVTRGIMNNTHKNHNPLALTIKNLKKQKLLGQSDYETGDEGIKKYIYEKNL